MVNYEKTEWKSGDVVTSAKLNKLEQRVAQDAMPIFEFDIDMNTDPVSGDYVYEVTPMFDVEDEYYVNPTNRVITVRLNINSVPEEITYIETYHAFHAALDGNVGFTLYKFVPFPDFSNHRLECYVEYSLISYNETNGWNYFPGFAQTSLADTYLLPEVNPK